MDMTVKSPKDFASYDVRDDSANKIHKKDEEVDRLLTDSGIGALAKCAAATTKKFRVFWILLLMSAVIGFTCNVYHILARYYRVPVLTQLNQEFDNFTWPDITLCNPTNPIPFWRSQVLKEKWNVLLNKSREFPTLRYSGGKAVNIYDQYLLMSSITPHDFYNDTATAIFWSLSVMFQQETISTSSGDFARFLGVRNFHNALEGRLGSSRYPIPCLTLKPSDLAPLIGEDKNPSDILAIKFHLILDYESYKTFNNGFENRKMYMFLSLPNATLDSASMYYVYPGTGSSFIVTENNYKRIQDCSDNRFKVEMFDSTMAHTKIYNGSFETCREYISQKMYYEKCRCYNPFLPIYKFEDKLPRLCLNISLYNKDEIAANLKCLNDVSGNFSKKENFKSILKSECAKYRVPLCHQRSYNYRRSTNNWKLQMSPRRRQLLKRAVFSLPNYPNGGNFTEDFANLNVATVKFSRSPGFVSATLEEYEYPLSQLLSDIGGTMGLWLGISVISLFEILQFFIQISCLLTKRSKSKD